MRKLMATSFGVLLLSLSACASAPGATVEGIVVVTQEDQERFSASIQDLDDYSTGDFDKRRRLLREFCKSAESRYQERFQKALYNHRDFFSERSIKSADLELELFTAIGNEKLDPEGLPEGAGFAWVIEKNQGDRDIYRLLGNFGSFEAWAKSRTQAVPKQLEEEIHWAEKNGDSKDWWSAASRVNTVRNQAITLISLSAVAGHKGEFLKPLLARAALLRASILKTARVTLTFGDIEDVLAVKGSMDSEKRSLQWDGTYKSFPIFQEAIRECFTQMGYQLAPDNTNFKITFRPSPNIMLRHSGETWSGGLRHYLYFGNNHGHGSIWYGFYEFSRKENPTAKKLLGHLVKLSIPTAISEIRKRFCLD